MQQVFDITAADIAYAEAILLPNGKPFDQERLNFIENQNTIDLQAVPGSGKTTALLAKLLIIERKLPLIKGGGILVLSHTNAAIDEIKHKIEKYCPKLFSYPNFIGTIQSFVDQFLAIPFYVIQYKKKPLRIDNEIYDEIVKKTYNSLPNSAAKSWLNRLHNPESVFVKMRFDKDLNLLKEMNGDFLLRSANASATYTQLANAKKNIMKSGFLCFDDAYLLAELYCKHIPGIIEIVQKRFPFVFVDEMQDMDKHQYEILEKLFYGNGTSISTFQRVGDKNQAIYSSPRSTEIWIDRNQVLKLKGSQRLSIPIARVASQFAVYKDQDYEITGLNECKILPQILIYDDQNLGLVIPFFSKTVKEMAGKGDLPDFEKYPVKAIAWNTEWKDDDARDNISKLRLCDFYSDYNKDSKGAKIDYSCLKA
ncbi:superfamily I DNA/RNA helicase [Pedobacter sp. CG_S7]|uniref:UvrD-helicase domain-containing protein n=1 Tax=Pedobacter sp. CG_S7 TaxID=3143930 RepID=UPI003398A053